MTEPASLTIHTLRKSFGERCLFTVSDLLLEAGKLYVLTGDNGSGKTTLLKIIAGLERADQLSLSFAGQHAEGEILDRWRHEIIYVHQHPYLFHSSIVNNIGYGLKMRGIDSATRQQFALEAMEWAGLRARADVPPKRLSGGERQRVALARAKVLHPKVLLVDEPTANLDRHARAQIVALLQKTVAEQRTVVVACHDREIIDLPGTIRLDLHQGMLRRTSESSD